MCLEEAPFYAVVSMPTVQSAAPYRHRKRSRESFAALVCDVTNGLRNESTVLHMIRSPLETGVLQRDSRVWLHPKRRLACPLGRLPMKPNGARQRRRMDVPRRGTLLRSGQYDNSAKRDFVSSFRAKREIFVIRGLAVNDWKFQTGNLLSTYLRASPHIYCSEAATTTLNPETSSLLKMIRIKHS